MKIMNEVDVRNTIISFFRQEELQMGERAFSILINEVDIVFYMQSTVDVNYNLQGTTDERREKFISFGELLFPGILRKDIQFMRRGYYIEYICKHESVFGEKCTLQLINPK